MNIVGVRVGLGTRIAQLVGLSDRMGTRQAQEYIPEIKENKEISSSDTAEADDSAQRQRG